MSAFFMSRLRVRRFGRLAQSPPMPSSNIVYTVGTSTSVMSSDVSRPPMTTRASGTCSSLPSPMPSDIGTRPSMVAIDVIRIGRSRVRPASLHRLAQRQPVAPAQHVGVVDQQDAVADDDAGQHDDADVGLHVERRARQLEREHDADARPSAPRT